MPECMTQSIKFIFGIISDQLFLTFKEYNSDLWDPLVQCARAVFFA